MWNIKSLEHFETEIQRLLKEDLPYFERSERYRERVAPLKKEKMASVLMLISYSNRIQDTKILFTERSRQNLHHAGQISFPGGAREHDDVIADEQTVTATALRETQEEVGIDPKHVKVLGELPPLPTFASAFWVTPVVGLVGKDLDSLVIATDQREVASYQWISLYHLIECESVETLGKDGRSYELPLFEAQGYRIWGMTAVILSNFIQRLRSNQLI